MILFLLYISELHRDDQCRGELKLHSTHDFLIVKNQIISVVLQVFFHRYAAGFRINEIHTVMSANRFDSLNSSSRESVRCSSRHQKVFDAIGVSRRGASERIKHFRSVRKQAYHHPMKSGSVDFVRVYHNGGTSRVLPLLSLGSKSFSPLLLRLKTNKVYPLANSVSLMSGKFF